MDCLVLYLAVPMFPPDKVAERWWHPAGPATNQGGCKMATQARAFIMQPLQASRLWLWPDSFYASSAKATSQPVTLWLRRGCGFFFTSPAFVVIFQPFGWLSFTQAHPRTILMVPSNMSVCPYFWATPEALLKFNTFGHWILDVLDSRGAVPVEPYRTMWYGSP